MTWDFDRIIDRSDTNCVKWRTYPNDVLPLWVADMDFAAPEPIQKALMCAVEHGVFGYEFPTRDLAKTVAARMEKLYGWEISPEAVVATPGVIAGFNAAARTVCKDGEGILVQPPVYPPFLSVHDHTGTRLQASELARKVSQGILSYDVNWETLEREFNAGTRTGLFLFCNPHNPTGRIFSRDELLRIGNLCLDNDVYICSDEIHSEVLLGNSCHIPIASLDPQIAKRTITLIAPSKTFNVPGLFCAFAIITDDDLRQRFKKMVNQMAMHVNSLGLIAAQVAFSGDCDDWLAALSTYLTANRDFLVENIQKKFGDIHITVPDATYLSWMDCRELIKSGKIEGSPQKFFLSRGKVAFNDGAEFGSGGQGFIRLNFGCPRRTLEEALKRMQYSLV